MGGGPSHEQELDRVLPAQVILDGSSPAGLVQQSHHPVRVHTQLSLKKQRVPIALTDCSCDNWRVKLVFNLDEACDISFKYSGVASPQDSRIGPGQRVEVYSPEMQTSSLVVVVKASQVTVNINIAVKAHLARVTSQQASMNGQIFDIQSIYGIGSDKKCVVCMTNDVTVALQPCRHACLCGSCSETSQGLSQCPICRSPANGFIKIQL